MKDAPHVPVNSPRMILSLENEDCCFTAEPGAAAGPSHLCFFARKDDNDDEDGAGESGPAPAPAPAPAPCRKSPGAGRRSDLLLLGCGALLAAVGLGNHLLALAQPEESVRPRWEGFFHRSGSQKRSASPPTRRLFRRESPRKACERGPASSSTLLPTSPVSDCNSTRSLLRADSEERLAFRPGSPPAVSQQQAPFNPLVNTQLESFKRNPRQSLTPTHVPSAPRCARGLRRTPSDGAIKRGCPPSSLEPLPEKPALENAGEGSCLISYRWILGFLKIRRRFHVFPACLPRWIPKFEP